MTVHATTPSVHLQDPTHHHFGILYSDEDKALVRRLFDRGYTSTQISEKLGRSTSSIRGLWRAMGLSRKGQRRPTKWKADETVFDAAEIREEASYWVGFLLADGCVHVRPGRSASISLALQKRDKAHVVRFARFVGLPAAVVREGRSSWSMSFRSDPIANTLARYGVVPRKTLTATPAAVVSSRHFWRGVVDGDGCLSIRRALYAHSISEVACLSLAGSIGTTSAFSEFVSSNFPDCSARPRFRKGSNCWVWSTSGRYAKLVVELLYADAAVALDRKSRKAARIIKEFSESGVLVRYRPEGEEGFRPKKFLTYNGETKSISEWARSLGIPRSVIAVRISRGWSVEDTIRTEPRPYPRGRG